MLKPIPSRILKHDITLNICTGVDVWQNPSYQTKTISRVVMQPCHETRRTAENTEVVLRAMCFIDARRSTPLLDYWGLQKLSELNGHVMTLTFGSDSFSVITVDKLFDDEGILHHWELGLV